MRTNRCLLRRRRHGAHEDKRSFGYRPDHTLCLNLAAGLTKALRLATMAFLLVGNIVYAAGVAHAAGIIVSNARVAASENQGDDVPLLLTVRNESPVSDALARAKCPFANFNERQTVDQGEGSPATRSIPSIPIPANSIVDLKLDGYHLMMLQTRQKLMKGDVFKCSLSFQKAGAVEVDVQVSGSLR